MIQFGETMGDQVLSIFQIALSLATYFRRM